MGSEHTFHNTQAWQEPLLEALRSVPILTRASRMVGISRHRVMQVMREDPAFKLAVDEAKVEGIENAEKAAFKRAVKGVTKGVWHNGKRVGEERVYSDSLLLAILKGYKKETYAERTELTGANGEPLGGAVDDTAKAARLAALLNLAKAQRALAEASEDLC
jgi:hypothetical protein